MIMVNLMLVALLPWCLGALLAALPQDGSTVRDVFEILGWIFGLIMLAWRVFGTAKSKGEATVGPQPFRVSKADEFVLRREFDELRDNVRREHEELRESIEGRFDKLDRARESSINGLHSHISNLAISLKESIAAVDGRIEDRLKIGNAVMAAHGEQIAALNERTKKAR